MAEIPFKPYTGQGKLRFWCQKVLPLVYDDSLSYYELLGKVVEYLNNTIKDVSACEDNITALRDAFIQLQDYVNEMFDDFAPEIERIIDEMIDNGEFGEILTDVVNGLIANEYSTTQGYAQFDYVIKDGKLYCATASTSGEWDATKWRETTVGADMQLLNQRVYNLNAGQVAYDNNTTYNSGTVGYKIQNLNNAGESILDDCNNFILGIKKVTPATLNIPENAYGFIESYTAQNNTWKWQFLTTTQTPQKIFKRANINNTGWTEWIRIADNTDVESLQGSLSLEKSPVNPCIKEAKLIAHQGGSSFIKSSNKCFQYGITQGFKILEADLRRTTDNQIVVWHDQYYGSKIVTQSTLAELRAENIGYGCTILTFNDLLQLLVDNNIAIELDFTEYTLNATLANEIITTIKRYNPSLDSIIFTAMESKMSYLASIEPSIIMCMSSIHTMAALTDNVKSMLKSSRYPMISQNIDNTNSDIADVKAWAKENHVIMKGYTADTNAKLNNAFQKGYNKVIVDNISAIGNYQYYFASSASTMEPLNNYIYEERCECVNSNPFFNSIVVLENNLIQINFSLRLLKNLTANQNSLLLFPENFRFNKNTVTLCLTGTSFTELNTPMPAYITPARYLSVKHNGLNSGTLIAGSIIVPVDSFILPFT